jgi:hypothetical protein
MLTSICHEERAAITRYRYFHVLAVISLDYLLAPAEPGRGYMISSADKLAPEVLRRDT